MKYFLVVLLAMAGLLVLIMPIRDCPACGGYLRTRGRTEKENWEGKLNHRDTLGCPGCADRGSVAVINRRSPRKVDSLIARLARVAVWPHEDIDGDEEALKALALRNGTDSGEYVAWGSGVGRGITFAGRFVHVGTKDFFLIALIPMSYSNQEEDAPTRILLFDLKGQLLDRLDAACLRHPRDLRFEPRILSEPADDGAWVQIDIRDWSSHLSVAPFRILHDGLVTTFNLAEQGPPPEWRSRGLCRVGIRSDRLWVLAP